MQKLSRILSPDFNPRDLIAVAPEWRRADFNRAVFYLSGRLKAAKRAKPLLYGLTMRRCLPARYWRRGMRARG
jgi:hypothetical protein